MVNKYSKTIRLHLKSRFITKINISTTSFKDMKGQVFIVNKKFVGLPSERDFTMQYENLPELKDGEFLAEAVYLSVDPYQRSFASGSGVGNSLYGEQVAKILESKHDKFPVGKYVIGDFGWRTHTITAGSCPGRFFPMTPRIISEKDYSPLSLALGVLGMTGNTAYYGFLDICHPKQGDVVVITAAGGAVGSHVGQIAKLKGCHVVGITGTDEKCHWITEQLKFDMAINYKKSNFEQKLAEATPDGIDSFFDNVGGELGNKILKRMKNNGTVAECGSIATYNDGNYSSLKIPKDKQIRFEGVNVFKNKDRWLEGIDQNRTWLNEGKLKFRETITKGFENMPKAFISMLQGGNIGKAIVHV